MSTLSQHQIQSYYDLRTVLVDADLITVISGTQTGTPTVSGTASTVDPDASLTVTITNYDSDNFYHSAASGTITASGSDSYIWTAPSIAGDYDFSVYAVTHSEVLSDAGIWSIEVASDPEWASYFDNTHWTATTGSWDGSKWVAAGNTIELAAIGSWVTGFRPTKFRSLPSGMMVGLNVYAGATHLYADPMYTPGVTIDLWGFGVSDITRVHVLGTAWMSSLEFYG